MMSAIVGYYSPGDDSNPASLLDRIIARLNITDAKRVSLPCASSLPRAEIVASGRHTFTDCEADRLTASLSVSGITHQADVEVSISDKVISIRRDITGRSTLYWTQSQDALWFASRLDHLLPLLEERRVSLEGLYGYLCFSCVPTPLSIVEGISSVKAGAMLTSRPGSLPSSLAPIEEQFEDWREADSLIDCENEAVSRVRRRLEESVEEDIPRAGEPCGIFLSGGLDSSVAAALLARAGARVRAYALDFGPYGLSELPYAEAVATSLSIPLTKVRASPSRIRKAIEATTRALDQPYGDGVTAPLHLLSEAAAGECRVVFNGEGGDQLFGGWANKPIIASGIYNQHAPETPDLRAQYLRTFHRLHGYERDVFTDEAFERLKNIDAFNWIEDALDPSKTRAFIHRLRRANLLLKGAHNIQPRASSLATCRGLMLRSPFCYKPLADLTFEIAGRFFLRGSCEKYLLKKAVEGWLPDVVVWREKRGMGVPLTEWIFGPLRLLTAKWLAPRALAREGRLRPDLAMRIAAGLLSGHVQGRRIGENLWMLLMWQMWRKSVLGEKLKSSPVSSLLLPRAILRRRAERSLYR